MSTLRPIELHCAQRTNPLGIDDPAPCLGWALAGGGRDAVQSAWQVQVGTATGSADMWDSGRVAGDAQLQIAYAGRALAARTRYMWRVRVWDGTGSAGPWSDEAWFETAFTDPAAFAAPWIGAAGAEGSERVDIAPARWVRAAGAATAKMALLRTEFELPVDVPVASACVRFWVHGRADAWACSRYHLLVNGSGRDGWKHLYPKTGLSDWDIAAELRPGANRLALRAWTAPDAACIALVLVELADGRVLRFGTGDHPWLGRAQAEEADLPGWDDAAAPGWQPVIDHGPFGRGPWPADDLRNRADRPLSPVELRRGFAATGRPLRARLYATACGIYELALNGARVGDRWLAPGWTMYGSRLHYQTYDVTGLVREGANELRAVVADGWYSGHTFFGPNVWGTGTALKLELHLDHADGSTQVIRSDPAGWEAGYGTVRLADLFHGQHEDRTRAVAWRAATAVAPAHGRLQAQPDEPVRLQRELPVRSLVEVGPGRVLADFGQNLAGGVRLRLNAPRGTRLVLRYAEVLDLSGAIWTENLRSAKATDVLVCGGGDEVFEPRFTFHGFRYCEISGLPAGLRPEQLTALAIASDLEDGGTFACGDPLLMRLQENIRWGWRGNSISIPTDCPQRDERAGWTGDAQIFIGTALFNSRAAAFFGKYMQDMVDSQHPLGAMPDFAPCATFTEYAHYGWGDAAIIVPWTLWQQHGDLRLPRTHWAAMRRYLDHRDRHASDGLNGSWSYGDWLSPAPQTSNDLLGPVYHAWMHRLMAEMADALGLAEDAAHHRSWGGRIATAWRAKFLAPDGRIQGDTQTAYVCALRSGILPEALRAAAEGHLVAAIERAGGHLATGFLGTGHLLPTLSAAGRDDVAWRVLMQEGAPGWLYTVLNGATTMWERWDSYSPQTGPVNIGNMNSYNHYAFGAVGEWMYAAILGIGRAADDIGWQRLVIRPVPGGRCTHASGSRRTPRGEVAVAWRIAGGRFSMDVVIPPNCTAAVHVPGSAAVNVGAGAHSFSSPS